MVSGYEADEWVDASYDVSLMYAIDAGVLCGKHPSERVNITKSAPDGQMQVTQNRVLPVGYYEASVWLRASPHVSVLVSLYAGDQSFLVKAMATPTWTRVGFSGFIGAWSQDQFMISTSRPGTLWIADADLRRTSDGYVLAAAVVLAFGLTCLGATIFVRRSLQAAGPGSITVTIGDGPADTSPTAEKPDGLR